MAAPGSGQSSESRPKPRRPPNGYNLFFRYQRARIKARERAQAAFAKMKNNSSGSGVGAANATSAIARSWESNTELGFRFEMEAKECQENYRSEIEAWRAANTSDAHQEFLGNLNQQASFPRLLSGSEGCVDLLPSLLGLEGGVDSLSPSSLASEDCADSKRVTREPRVGLDKELVHYLA